MRTLRTGETNAWLASAKPVGDMPYRPRLVVGRWSLSVQASPHHYSTPRAANGPWSEVEVGFPSGTEEMLLPWAESDDNTHPCSIVYAYVPVDVVDTVIAMRRAAARVREQDHEALVIVDALRSEGVVVTDDPDPDRWTDGERFELAHALAIVDSFKEM